MAHRSIWIMGLYWRRFARWIGWNHEMEDLDAWFDETYLGITKSPGRTPGSYNVTKSYDMDVKIIGPPARGYTRSVEIYEANGPGMDSRAMKVVNDAVALQLYQVQRKIERELENQMGGYREQVPTLGDIHREMIAQGVDPEKCRGVAFNRHNLREKIEERMDEMGTPWYRLG
jgi:hypothetical protein